MSEETVSVRWLKDSEAGGHYVNDRVYSGKGPQTIFEDQYIAGRHQRVERVLELGEVQEVPAGVASVLAQAGFVEPVEAPGGPQAAKHAKAKGKGKA